MAKKDSKETKLSRCLKAPIRVLIKARDFYIQSMTQCAGRVEYGGAMGCPTAQISTLPRSFSVNSTRSSNDEDLRELIRAASTRGLNNKVQLELLRLKQPQQSPTTGVNVVPRSQSAGIGRIDEDKPCDFAEDIKVNADVFPRSRSYAVPKRASILQE